METVAEMAGGKKSKIIANALDGRALVSQECTVWAHPPKGSWYEIPYRSIRPRGLDNVLVASRCIDSTHEAHAAVRVTNQIMTVGQGAGAAAALCAQKGLGTREISVELLKETLRSQGAFV